MNLGDVVTFEDEEGNTLTGTIVCIYAVPKDYDLVDINVNGVTYFGISTENCTKVE